MTTITENTTLITPEHQGGPENETPLECVSILEEGEDQTERSDPKQNPEISILEGKSDPTTLSDVAVTCGNASSAVVINNDAENIDLQTGHTDHGEVGEEDILTEGWSMDMFKEEEPEDINKETIIGKMGGQSDIVNKTYKKSNYATKKTN